jgi:hypothetical protein
MHQQVRRLGRRIAIALGGGLLVAAGLILAIPLVPGPGILLILAGLGILSLEFERPRIWLATLKAKGRGVAQRLVRRRSRSDDG